MFIKNSIVKNTTVFALVLFFSTFFSIKMHAQTTEESNFTKANKLFKQEYGCAPKTFKTLSQSNNPADS